MADYGATEAVAAILEREEGRKCALLESDNGKPVYLAAWGGASQPSHEPDEGLRAGSTGQAPSDLGADGCCVCVGRVSQTIRTRWSCCFPTRT